MVFMESAAASACSVLNVFAVHASATPVTGTVGSASETTMLPALSSPTTHQYMMWSSFCSAPLMVDMF